MIRPVALLVACVKVSPATNTPVPELNVNSLPGLVNKTIVPRALEMSVTVPATGLDPPVFVAVMLVQPAFDRITFAHINRF